MQYWIILQNRRKQPYHYHDALFPGLLVPDRLWPKLRADFARKQLDICHHCNMDCHCHPIGVNGEKYCTILFHDAVKPAWKLEEVC